MLANIPLPAGQCHRGGLSASGLGPGRSTSGASRSNSARRPGRSTTGLGQSRSFCGFGPGG
eukprot:5784524-Prorocentrum_lima.AAC.1